MGLVLRIDHSSDRDTAYAQAFRVKLVFANFATKYRNDTVVEAINQDAKRDEVDACLMTRSVAFVSAAGHGKTRTFLGENGINIWTDASQNLDLLKGKIIHLLACDSGGVLGRAITLAGAKAFWGYSGHFVFNTDGDAPSSLKDDTRAEVFFKMDALIDEGILSRLNATDIYRSVWDYVVKEYPQLSRKEDRAALLFNFVHLVCPAGWGDPTAKM